jgi:regulatory protein YycI of two-component signal transduction system YycFG
MDEHIIPLKQTLKEQQKRIDEQKEMISKQAHLAVQSIQEEQHLKSYDVICVNRVNDMTSNLYGYINVMESKTGPPGILFLVFKTDF